MAAAGSRSRLDEPDPGRASMPRHRKGTTVVAKSKYVKAGKGSRPAIYGHLKIYLRSRGENEPERKFFNREKHIERKDQFMTP